jgi:hypothetical protein
MYGYLHRFKSGAILVRTDELDFSALPAQDELDFFALPAQEYD